MTTDKPRSIVPKLRFPEFENSGPWEPIQLKEVLVYEQPGKYIVEDSSYLDTGTPVLTANKSFVLGYTAETDGIYDNVPAIIFDDFTTDTKYVDFAFKVRSSAIKILTSRRDDELRFVFELMSRIRFDPTQHKRYYISQYQHLEIALPNRDEQRKIADCLGSLDDLISAEGRKLEALREHKRGLMQQLFPQPGETVPRLRFPEFCDSGEWKHGTLGQIGKFIGGGTPSTSIPEYWGGDIQWFTPSEINERNLSKSKRTITCEGLRSSSARLLPTGALLITTRATIGDVGIAGNPCATNQGFQSLVVFGREANAFWYYWLVQHKRELIRHASGSTFLEIRKTGLKQIPIVRPNKHEQQKIADCLGSLDDLIAVGKQKFESLQQHKQGLMQKLFPCLETK